MIDLSEYDRVMGMTSDRVIAAWQLIQPIMLEVAQDVIKSMRSFYRSLYTLGIIDTPMHTHHPMTARKMRGAIRRLKAGEIDVKY